MAITAMGLGTKTTPAGTNLDPQAQFWSFLNALGRGAKQGILSGFTVTQASPAGLNVRIGGAAADVSAGVQDSAIVAVNGRHVLLSSDSQPQTITLATAPATGTRVDAIVSYIDQTTLQTATEKPGTPEYIKTVAISGNAGGAMLTDAQIKAKLPAAAGGAYIKWADVSVGANATQVVDGDITLAPTTTVGDITMSFRAEPSAGRLFMNGQTYKRSDYPRLWSYVKLHSAYGTTTAANFTLADMSGRAPFGTSSNESWATLGNKFGQSEIDLTLNNLPDLTVFRQSHGSFWGVQGGNVPDGTWSSGVRSDIIGDKSAYLYQPTNVLNPGIAVNFEVVAV